MKLGGLVVMVALAAGCAGAKVEDSTQPAAHDLGAPRVPKTPPAGTGGGPTAAACNGVTEKGRCEISDKGQTAVTCDVAANQLRQFDCTAMHKVCVIDSTRGASCTALPPPVGPGNGAAAPADMAGPRDLGAPPTPRDMATTPTPRDMATTPPAPRDMAQPPAPRDMANAPMCVSGVDYRGYCASATGSGAPDTAIWCDPSTGQTLVVDCAARGQTCVIDGCAEGAYCCDGDTTPDMAMPPQMSDACDALGYTGECDGEHARWCSGGQLFDIDCAGRGQTCMVDGCAQGAYCCDAPPPPDDTPDLGGASECDALGLRGECGGSDGNVARYCSDGTVVEDDCTAQGLRCEVDTCATGAACCSS